MATDPETMAHKEWLGYVQPVGLVVSTPALLAAQAHINKNIIPDHARFLEWVEETTPAAGADPVLVIRDLPGMFQDVFEWQARDLVGHGEFPLPADLEHVLVEYNETLRPTYAVPVAEASGENAVPWQMLIQTVETARDLDAAAEEDDRRWQASPHARFERLLREKGVPIGLLFNGTQLRLVYAPKGESSGYATFPVQAMAEVSGRPIFAALHLLLSADRLFTLPGNQRLPAILEASRKYQSEVSTKLSGQVLSALHELLRGFQAANDQRHGALLREVLADDPNHIYKGLLTVLMRLVFTLYAEERGLLSGHAVYANHYAVIGLFERLREENNRYPDTMDQRFGAWAQLLALFRIVYDGAAHDTFRLPPRRGHLFDPDRFPFLEGRPYRASATPGERIAPPMVSDGVVYRVLKNLLILDGERLSYRSLDVEQIGSVYETMMGFALEVAQGPSIAIRPVKAHGAPVCINLDALLKTKPAARDKWIIDQTGQKLTKAAVDAVKDATTPEEAVAALGKKVSPTTPHIIPAGAMLLQPSDERRRSGSHYTPRSFTEPIVRKTLEPILDRLGRHPQPEALLDLKIADIAVGSAAFLVETCRQLADELVSTWHYHHCLPVIPPDEDEVLYARRLVAQRCLYGVDRNPMAVDLAKLSLWLVTMAKDHPFTFLDHAIKCGDSLVGLTNKQIAAFHWDLAQAAQRVIGQDEMEKRIEAVTARRREIIADPEDNVYAVLRKKARLAEADAAAQSIKTIGDLVIAAFFAGAKPRERQQFRDEYLQRHIALEKRENVAENLRWQVKTLEELRSGEHPIRPFHWEIEFPEVFTRENPGFDGIVGNPPFLGGSRVSSNLGDSYRDWLLSLHENSHGNSDLVAHFFRQAFELVATCGCIGLIATNTIGQGDTRTTGLQVIRQSGGTIYSARRRSSWPGEAAVSVSIVHIHRGVFKGDCRLDEREVDLITAYLFHRGGDENPRPLKANALKSFQGVKTYGQGFIFDNSDTKGECGSLSEMRTLIASHKKNSERIFPYLGGDEVNSHPSHQYSRYAIDFGDLDEIQAREYPDLFDIVERKVKPYRMRDKRESYRKRWWQYGERRAALSEELSKTSTVYVTSQVSKHLAFVRLPSDIVFSQRLIVVTLVGNAAFSTLQGRIHEGWALFFGSSLEDRPVYTPTDCFETFPFPPDWETNAALEKAGKIYYEFRAELMIRNDEGLTKTYNRFHDPDERSPDILKLRDLHTAMDRAVLGAYGWTDIPTDCEFLLDYEEEDEDPSSPDGYEGQAGRAGKKRKKKKPWRYRWPDEVRDEVLARLLALNAERHQEEVLAGLATDGKAKKVATKSKTKKAKAQDTGDLFDA